ncbi:MAG TPA: hypothetical protein VGV90_16185 [Solirubrobacteraceae bacterium]|nr:hypothetical protein [Solirubrobacteraceae bacterium]
MLQRLRTDCIGIAAGRLDRGAGDEIGDDLLGDMQRQSCAGRALERALRGFEAPHRDRTGPAAGNMVVELLAVLVGWLLEPRDERRLQPRTTLRGIVWRRGVNAARGSRASRGLVQQCMDIELIRCGCGDENAAHEGKRVRGRRGRLARRRHVLAVGQDGCASLGAQGRKRLRFAVANGI